MGNYAEKILKKIGFRYFPLEGKNFEEKNVRLATLSNYDSLLEQALDSSYINEEELITLNDWRKNPSEWKQ